MYEKRNRPTIGKFEFPEDSPYVVVNSFEDTSLKTFLEDCDKVLKQGQDFLPIVIDSYGGMAHTVFGMLDFLKYCGSKVITICQGKCMSAGALLFSAGVERYVGPKSTVMVHEAASFAWGKNVELQNSAKEIERLNALVFEILDENTGQLPGYWLNLVKNNNFSDLYLNANDSVKHKLATHVGLPHIETNVVVTRSLVL